MVIEKINVLKYSVNREPIINLYELKDTASSSDLQNKHTNLRLGLYPFFATRC